MKDIIYVEHQNFVSVTDNSVKCVNLIDKKEVFFPIDEIEILVFDNVKSYFSSRLIERCMQENIGILFCDQKHAPLSMLISEYGHSQRLKRLESQLRMTQKEKNRIWRKIVISKINNQADCLKNAADKKVEADYLKMMSKQVDEGDHQNKEAYAARRYFFSLFGPNFRRGRFDDAINAGLNYGYALVRAIIKKELAFHGFEMSIGIHHDSKENPFNLSDDIIEPFRPFIDECVYEYIYCNNVIEFTIQEKKKLLEIFFEKCVIDGKACSIADAVKVTCASLIACYDNKSSSYLRLPSFVEVGK